MTYAPSHADPRLPFAPLAAEVARRELSRTGERGAVVGGDRLVAECCGVTRRTVIRWRQRGLTWDTADKAACALGLHAANIWGNAFWGESGVA